MSVGYIEIGREKEWEKETRCHICKSSLKVIKPKGGFREEVLECENGHVFSTLGLLELVTYENY
jgi:hypothetical protein